jgi:hypothetical protein
MMQNRHGDNPLVRRPKTGGRRKGTLNKATVIAREAVARHCRPRTPLSPEAARARRERYYLRAYGIGLVDYEALLAAQGGRCAACGNEDPGHAGGRFRIDRDDTTGSARALLCLVCTTLLGYIRKQAHRLTAVYEYLQRNAGTQEVHP